MNNLNLMTMLAQWAFLTEEDKRTFLTTVGATMAPVQTIKEIQASKWSEYETKYFEEYYKKKKDVESIHSELKFWASSNKTLLEVKQKYDEYKAAGL